MIPTSREKGFQAKQEDGNSVDNKLAKPPSSSRQWSAFRNPRIVRVSRTFGGKDRHSKVCTVRGLRDRRIRLSVPTAVQLYDLQDKLGLGQPSKVIDWLIEATKDDIDRLPPLQMPPGFCTEQFHQHMMLPHESNASLFAPSFDANSIFFKDVGEFHNPFLSSKEGIKINSIDDHESLMSGKGSKYWDMDFSLGGRSKEVDRELIYGDYKGKWVKTNDLNQDGFVLGDYNGQSSTHQKFFPFTTHHHSSLPNSLMNNSMGLSSQNNSFDFPNLSLSQFGGHGYNPNPNPNPSQAETSFNGSVLQSSLAQFSSGSQLLFYPPATMAPSLFPTYPPYVTTTATEESDSSRQRNRYQFLSSSSSQQIHSSSLTMNNSSAFRPLQLNVNHGFGDTQNHNNIQPDRDHA